VEFAVRGCLRRVVAEQIVCSSRGYLLHPFARSLRLMIAGHQCCQPAHAGVSSAASRCRWSVWRPTRWLMSCSERGEARGSTG
jgi:hypothetical protein